MGQTDDNQVQHTVGAPEPARQDEGARLDWRKSIEHVGGYAFIRKCYQRGLEQSPADVLMTDEDKVLPPRPSRCGSGSARGWRRAGCYGCSTTSSCIITPGAIRSARM